MQIRNHILPQVSPLILGFVLATAGFLKAIHVQAVSTDAFVQFSISLFEIWLAVLVVFGGMDRRIRIAMLVFFGVGLLHNARLVALGVHDCGCFGHLSMDPIYTAAIDAVCLTIAWFAPTEDTDRTVLTLTSLLALVIAIAIAGPLIFDKSRDGYSTSKRMSLQCDPEIGKPLQFASHIVGGSDFMKGSWQLLFFRSSCPDCVSALNQMNTAVDFDKKSQLAVIEIPPLGRNSIELSLARYSYLDPRIEWEIPTPMRIKLSDGLVVEMECPRRLR